MSSREAAYDAEVAPLMAEVIRVCKAHGIPVFASFQIDDGKDEEESRFCTTAILKKGDAPALHKAYAAVYCREPQFVALTVTTSGPKGSSS
jgi:hypothetical protein